MIRSGLYAGSFDPFTLGHLDIVARAAKLLDRLVIAVVEKNQRKPFLFSLEDRIKMIQESVKDLQGVEVIPFSGLVVDLAKEMQVDVLIRSVRGESDIHFEFEMAASNRALAGIESFFLYSSPEYTHISSTLVREIALNGGDLDQFVPRGNIALIQKSVG